MSRSSQFVSVSDRIFAMVLRIGHLSEEIRLRQDRHHHLEKLVIAGAIEPANVAGTVVELSLVLKLLAAANTNAESYLAAAKKRLDEFANHLAELEAASFLGWDEDQVRAMNIELDKVANGALNSCDIAGAFLRNIEEGNLKFDIDFPRLVVA